VKDFGRELFPAESGGSSPFPTTVTRSSSLLFVCICSHLRGWLHSIKRRLNEYVMPSGAVVRRQYVMLSGAVMRRQYAMLSGAIMRLRIYHYRCLRTFILSLNMTINPVRYFQFKLTNKTTPIHSELGAILSATSPPRKSRRTGSCVAQQIRFWNSITNSSITDKVIAKPLIFTCAKYNKSDHQLQRPLKSANLKLLKAICTSVHWTCFSIRTRFDSLLESLLQTPPWSLKQCYPSLTRQHELDGVLVHIVAN
jgi:hypothetical protein